MSLKIGIVGLPNVGKSTLFEALTKKKVEIANYPFTTISPNVGIVQVPDAKLEKVSHLFPEAEVVPAVIEIVDVAGLVKGAHKGEGLGNEFLAQLQIMDALLVLMRAFQDENVISLAKTPEEEFEILSEELSQKGLAKKPLLLICNVSGASQNFNFPACELELDAKLELEAEELDGEEQQELGFSSQLPQLISRSYKTLGLVTFYTVKGGKEIRALAIPEGTRSTQAGGTVHSDFEKKFIRAEVITAEKLLEAGSWSRAKESGSIRTEGRDYVVKDGDVIEFKI